MTTYVANFDGNNITFTKDNVQVFNPIPLNRFTLNDGRTPATEDDFTRDQQIFNYLDGLKDGCNVFQMQGLRIYPRASTHPAIGGYPVKDYIKTIRQNIVQAHKDSLNRTTWLKLKKGSPLNPRKNQWSSCSYDSGTNPAVFMENYQVVENFGTYMDPASKITSTSLWPPAREKIILRENFLRLMGFGNSSVEATTTGRANPLEKYNYKITIKIPGAINCSTPANQCIITNITSAGDYVGNTRAQNSFNFFAGNAVKNNQLASSANSRNKIKFIIAKEMGDKLQVLFHFLRYNQATDITLCTCDMPVFVLCITLKIPCIFTGAGRRPAEIPPGKKYYSIREYIPGTPATDLQRAKTRMVQIRNNIRQHNQEYIDKLKLLGNPGAGGTTVSIGGQKYALQAKFYKAAARDLNNINQRLMAWVPQGGLATVDNVNKAVKRMKKRFTFIPFIANTKKASKLKNRGLGVDDVAILAKFTYTKENPFPNGSKKPAFQTINPSYNNKSFKEIAFILKQTTSGGGKNKRKQKGGADLGAAPSGMFVNGQSVAMLYYMFPGDDDEPVRYQYTSSEEDDSPVFNMPNERSPSFQFVNQGNIYNHFYMNLMEELNRHFIASINQFLLTHSVVIQPEFNLIQFIELIYTELIYTSYIDNAAPIDIDSDYILQLWKDIKNVPPRVRSGAHRRRRSVRIRWPRIGTRRPRSFANSKGQATTKKKIIAMALRNIYQDKQRGIISLREYENRKDALLRGRGGGGGGRKTRKRRNKHKRKTRKKR